MKKYLLSFLILLTLIPSATLADVGMWVPALISSRIKDMKAKGSKLSAEEIYSINQASLKDAVVLYNGGCTGEIVSYEGLMLTNYHCGYYCVASRSTVDNDYLTNGFWAMNRTEEIPGLGVTASVLVRMEEVSDAVLQGVSDQSSNDERETLIKANSERLIQSAVANTPYTASVESFYYGNQYFLFVYEKFRDVRLVCAPPSSIGKFGGDTDNWMWPRHTGDFMMFRIYAGKDNHPADYAAENVPYRPRKAFTISTAPLREGDFTMVYGNPGRTQQYVTSDAINYTLNRGNPDKIRLRTLRLEIMNAEQAKDPATRIAYAALNARIANQWKKWQGETKGLARLNTLDKKRALEARFTTWAADKALYRDVLPSLHTLYTQLDPYAYARDYYQEAYQPIELIQFAKGAAKNIFNPEKAKSSAGFFNRYNCKIDFESAKGLLSEYIKNVPADWTPAYFSQEVRTAGNAQKYVDRLFHQSAFSSREKYMALATADSATKASVLKNDPALLLAQAFEEFYTQRIEGEYKRLNMEINKLYRLYMRGLMEMDPSKSFFPDANLTLRVAYGNIKGYKPSDGTYNTPFTTVDGIIEKDNPNIYDYNIPQRLRDLHASKAYGQWEENGSVPVCFMATNHTTGGNSGSPVLNSRGELIGINFDRNWECTMSDYEFNIDICRNIIVDMRYVLFVIDRIGGAGYLLKEMDIRSK